VIASVSAPCNRPNRRRRSEGQLQAQPEGAGPQPVVGIPGLGDLGQQPGTGQKSAVGRAKVRHRRAFAVPVDAQVVAGDGGVIQHDAVVGAASHAHETERFEDAQCLANRRPRDVEPCRELPLRRQAVARGEGVGDDLLLELEEDLLESAPARNRPRR